MAVDPVYKYIEKFRGGVQWYMMENNDLISSNSFKSKNEKTKKHLSMDKAFLSDYLSKKFFSKTRQSFY